MSDLEAKTTSINNTKRNPLEVEFRTNHPHVTRIGEKGIKRIDEHVVALVSPANVMHHERVYLVGMSPRTALNLLAWLDDNKELLTQLAAQEAL